jgi:peptidoglycan/LPS O-acetylase OafA/YrhL
MARPTSDPQSSNFDPPSSDQWNRPFGQRHLPVLDGIRGLAILLVLVIHLYPPASGWEHRLRSGCWCGVDLFFVLSGFLITGILLDSRGTPHYFRNFYMRRALRIFPLYYGALAVLIFLVPAGLFPPGHHARLCAGQGSLWLYVLNFWTVCRDEWMPCGMTHFWSLAVEEQFYLVWPLLVFLVSPRALGWVCVALILGALAMRTWLVRNGYPPMVGYLLPFPRMDAFAVGALVSLGMRQEGGPARLARRSRGAAITCAALLACLVARRQPCLEWGDPRIQCFGYSLVALFFGAVLAHCVTAPRHALLRRLFSVRPLRWLGRYSYGIYVVHLPLVYVFPQFFQVDRFPEVLRPFVGRNYWHICAALVLAVSLGMAYLSWHFYEKHFLKLKRFFPRGSGAAQVPLTFAVGKNRAA